MKVNKRNKELIVAVVEVFAQANDVESDNYLIDADKNSAVEEADV